MQEQKMQIGGKNILPKCLTFQQAAPYCGVSHGTLKNWEKAGLITVYNIVIPGSGRGRRLIDRESLDQFIEGSVGTITTTDICRTKENATGGAARA
jgi:hypothetical protein